MQYARLSAQDVSSTGSGISYVGWADHYKDVRVHHLVESMSVHCALLITDSIISQRPQKRRFQFEAM